MHIFVKRRGQWTVCAIKLFHRPHPHDHRHHHHHHHERKYGWFVPCSLLSLYIFGGPLIRSLADPTLAALIVCGPLQLVTHLCFFGP